VRSCRILDDIVAQEIGTRTMDELAVLLEAGEVGFSPIYTIEDIFRDRHVRAREAVVDVPDAELGTVRMQNVVPRFSGTPGAVHRGGPALGQDMP
jgi:crotonobetainyl-CoA:carnitine CoA-transferase CaiB-like acyl-CoA transferase